ncbi:MAG: release factor glutamine methyltransferase [Chloroflexota bacterium]|jgi:release factor glutamine methyltransferase|nr:release factor glutamine methyltransferase [Chloroflexota bacterium]
MARSDPEIGPSLTHATKRLRVAGSPTARLDAEVLIAHVIGRDRAWVLAHPEAPLEADAADALRSAVERRAAGEPIAYIRGFKEWRSLRIQTDARGLIPRPETELLAEAAMAEIAERLARDREPIAAWEVATGSGAVAAALAIRFRSALALHRLTLVASDVSPDALELAAENLALHGVGSLVTLACADLLEPAGVSLPRPDVVVANLPYVASAEVDARLGSLGYEPRVALDGGVDGLTVLRRLLSGLPTSIAPGAAVFLEIGVGQVDSIAALAPAGWSVSVVPDLAGLDRIVRLVMPD